MSPPKRTTGSSNATANQKTKKPRRRDTKLESDGAEFLVLGQLLLERIPTYKAYVNTGHYDLVAVDPARNTSATIQVKSRYQTDWDGFLINKFESDFVVFVALNRGYSRIRKGGNHGISAPDYYVFPTKYVRRYRDSKSTWGKVRRRHLADLEQYRAQWNLIREFLISALKG